jgi:hypothetical protein
MKLSTYSILFFLLVLSSACNSQPITIIEQRDINLFNEFKNYLLTVVRKREDIADPSHLKNVLLNYVFINRQLDSSKTTTINDSELTSDQLKSLQNELNSFYNFLRENEKSHLAENLTITPIRLSKDTFVYNRLTSFQKQNTFVLFDKRSPGKTISYILFLPPIKNKTDQPRIWSWTLLFKFGKLMFASVTGEEGYEYIFSPGQFAK